MADGNGILVVLIDDDPDEHFLFRADLEDSGIVMDFHGFAQPEDAVAFLNDHRGRRTLALTDLSMPGIDPVETVAAVAPLLDGGAVGVYSGTENPEMEEACRKVGASFYIVKPVTRDKLETVIADLPGVGFEDAGDGKVRLAAL